MKAILTGLFLAMVMPAFAMSDTPKDTLIGSDACQYLIEYDMLADVEYTPAVDVHGDPVVPADLNDNSIEPPEKYEIPIVVDAFENTATNTIQGIEGDIFIGDITVENNQLMFNGKPLTSSEQQALIALCSEDTLSDTIETEPTAE